MDLIEDVFVVAVEMADRKRFSLANVSLETLADKAKTAKLIIYLSSRRIHEDLPRTYQYGIITPGMDRKSIADRAKETLKKYSKLEQIQLKSMQAEMMHYAQPDIMMTPFDLTRWYEKGIEFGEADTWSSCDRRQTRKWFEHPKFDDI